MPSAVAKHDAVYASQMHMWDVVIAGRTAMLTCKLTQDALPESMCCFNTLCNLVSH